MTVAVIKMFKIVYIDDCEGSVNLRPEKSVKPLLAGSAVQKLRQRIPFGFMLKQNVVLALSVRSIRVKIFAKMSNER